MYNRYIPQSDGTFRRSRVAEPGNPPQAMEPEIAVPLQDAPKEAQQSHPPKKTAPIQSPGNTPSKATPQVMHDAGSVGSFLRGLLPQNFDTEDLIVVLLLLLMSGNSSNDQNAALLTLGIYLFL